MKNLHLWALAFVSLIPMASLAADDPPAIPAASLEWSVPTIEIGALIARVAKRTGKQFVVDPRVHGQIFIPGLDLDRVDYARLLAILAVNQYVAYESSGLVRVLPDANARQLPIAVSSEVSPKALDDEFVAVFVHTKNLCAAQLVPVLRPMQPQYAHLAALPQANTILLVDRAANARKIVALIEQLDKAVPAGAGCDPLTGVPRSDSK